MLRYFALRAFAAGLGSGAVSFAASGAAEGGWAAAPASPAMVVTGAAAAVW